MTGELEDPAVKARRTVRLISQGRVGETTRYIAAAVDEVGDAGAPE